MRLFLGKVATAPVPDETGERPMESSRRENVEAEVFLSKREARGPGAGTGAVCPASPGSSKHGRRGAGDGRVPGERAGSLRGGSGHRSWGTAGRFILCIGNSARHVSCST